MYTFIFLKVDGIKRKVNVNDSELEVLELSGLNITSFEGMPSNATTLYMGSNKIETFESQDGESLLPPNLVHLYIYSNALTSLKGLVSSLVTLDVGRNKITSLSTPDGKPLLPVSITNLDISCNCIKVLENLPPNLRILNAVNNQLTNLTGIPTSVVELDFSFNLVPSLEGLPPNLSYLDASFNPISSLENQDGVLLIPPSIRILSINSIRITHLPISLVQLQNLRNFSYANNRIENVHPSIDRFINNMHNRNDLGKCNEGIYNDSQNVHAISIQNSTRESLNALTMYKQEVLISKLSESEISFLNSKEPHSFFHLTEKEVLIFVENAIEVGPGKNHSQQLYALLREALVEGRTVCSTGRIGRIVNVLSGFDPNVQIKISDKEQIGTIISTFRARGESKESVVEELISRGIAKQEIDEWIEHY